MVLPTKYLRVGDLIRAGDIPHNDISWHLIIRPCTEHHKLCRKFGLMDETVGFFYLRMAGKEIELIAVTDGDEFARGKSLVIPFPDTQLKILWILQ